MEAADLTKSPSTISGLLNGKYMYIQQFEFILIIVCAKDFMECGTVSSCALLQRWGGF